MARSMTGYGRGEATDAARTLKAEIRSVNHRYLDISVRMPRAMIAHEPAVRALVQASLARGKVDVFLSPERLGDSGRQVALDHELATSYFYALLELEKITGERAGDKLPLLARYGDLFVEREPEDDDEQTADLIARALTAALDDLNRNREREGDHLTRDLLDKADELEALLKAVAARAPLVPEHYRDKLLARAEELFEERRPEWYDDQRLFAETALFADRAAIDEEITRLESHLIRLRRDLAGDEPCGRSLDFLMQEINREINTIGSKANDLDITRCVIDMKTTAEKIREQIQNLE